MDFELTNEEIKIIKECIKAAYLGPFFPDWVIHALIGFTKDEIKNIDEKMECLNLQDREQKLLVNNVINSLLGYPHGEKENWSKYISVDEETLLKIFKKIKVNKIKK
ncbi:hypothetical protein AGMMS49579_26620 [Spirochaetia bacterium]|nr:hypothetical protein AGMMS49579_26620 [Spirochaetia bacterium]